MPQTPEPQLVARCREGDEGAFRELVDRYASLVFALIARTVDERARVEELAQDVFLRVHRGLPYFRGDARLSTWIYRIVANVCAEERARAPRPEVPLELPAVDDAPPREFGAADRQFSDLELRDRLDKAMAQLPVHYRLIVNGHYTQGLRYEDLAEALGLPLGTVKTHLHRAKRRLRELLEGDLR